MLTLNGCGTGFERDEYGSIISGGTLDARSLRIGDCFNDLNPEEVKKLIENINRLSDDFMYATIEINKILKDFENEIFQLKKGVVTRRELERYDERRKRDIRSIINGL